MSSLHRFLLLAAVLCVFFAACAWAQEDEEDVPKTEAPAPANDAEEDDDTPEAPVEEDDEEEENPNMVAGATAKAFFPGYSDLKIPAGERVETLVAFNAGESEEQRTVVFVAAHLSPLGAYDRFTQNFSINAYSRKVASGELATIKYSVTPDAQVEPMDYSFVVQVYFANDRNETFIATAYNGTMTVLEPLGVDPRSIFTVLLFGGIAFAVFLYYTKVRPQPTRTARKAPESEAPKKSASASPRGDEVDMDYIDPEHLKFLKKKGRAPSK